MKRELNTRGMYINDRMLRTLKVEMEWGLPVFETRDFNSHERT